MYFWKTDKLVEELKNHSLNSGNFKNYYLAASILTLIGYYLARLQMPTNMSAYAIEAIGTIGATIFGLNFAFKSNGGQSGNNFLDRAVSISFPLLIKTVVVGLALGFVQVFLEVNGFEKAVFEWLNSISIILIQIVFYWRLSIHLRRVNA